MRIDPFRENEERAIEEALPVWLATNAAILRGSRAKSATEKRAKGPNSGAWKRETVDQIFARHGVVHTTSFTGEYYRYGMVEAELRRRAQGTEVGGVPIE